MNCFQFNQKQACYVAIFGNWRFFYLSLRLTLRAEPLLYFEICYRRFSFVTVQQEKQRARMQFIWRSIPSFNRSWRHIRWVTIVNLATPRDSFPIMAVTEWRTEVVIGGRDRKRSSNHKWYTFDWYALKITRLVNRHWVFQQRRWMRRS